MGISTVLDTQVLATSGADGDVLTQQADGTYLAETPSAAPVVSIANMTLDDTNLKVSDYTNLQDFAEGVDSALLKVRGTGVSTSYTSTVSVGGTTFAQPAVSGEISSDEGYFAISYAGATGITVATLSASSTYVYIDKNGDLQQQTTQPTRQDLTRKIFTMRIAVNTVSETIIAFEYFNNPMGNYENSIRDLYQYLVAQGVPLRIGQLVTGRTGDLGFDVGAGTAMRFGSTGDINNPSVISYAAVANSPYFLLTRTTGDSGAGTDLVKYWDNAGTITALGSTTCVAHRLYRFSSGNFAMQYGQNNYANMVLTKAGSKLEDYVLNPVLADATFMGWWLIESTATATSGSALAEFIPYTIGTQGGAASLLAGALLIGNNLSDLLDASTARANLAVLPIADPTFTGVLGQAAETTGTPAGVAQTITLSTANHQSVTLVSTSGDVTLTLTVPGVSAAGTIILKQHGSTPRDITWAVSSGSIIWLGTEPTWSSDAVSTYRVVSWRFNGTDIFLAPTEAGI